MKLERFIAIRYIRQKSTGYTRPIIRISIITVVLSAIVMILALAITLGFKKDIDTKVSGFAGDIQISRYATSSYTEIQPVAYSSSYLSDVSSLNFIRSIYPYASKIGLLKTDEYNHGIVLKGVDSSYNFAFFENLLVEGNLPDYTSAATSNDILISTSLSRLLGLRLNDKVRSYFVDNENIRARIFTVCGIFESGFSELDEQFIISDIRHIQRLNNWTYDQIEGFEILVKTANFEKKQDYANTINTYLPYDEVAIPTTGRYADLYQWLSLIDTNVWVILIIIAIVVSISLISVFLILVIEKTSEIGLFKTMGMRQRSIRRIFTINVLYIVGIGLLIGNTIALAFCFSQDKFHFLGLDSASYHMSYVPVFVHWPLIILINTGTLLICFLAMFLPSLAIGRIKEAHAIKYQA